MQIINQFNQPSLVESIDFHHSLELSSYEDFIDMWANPELLKKHRSFGGFIEGIGVLVRENYLEVKVIAGLWGGVIKALWEKQALYIVEYGKKRKTPRA
jgi:hypothetical protein